MKETKKYLRERWKSKEFLGFFPHSIDYNMNVEVLSDTDFRGITKLGCGEPFWKFPNLNSTNLKNIDFSYGDGSISISQSEIESFLFLDFNFDRSSSMNKSTIKNSTFVNAKLTFNANDTTFENCDFSNSKFKGGFNEWGFRRCKFINCNFTSAFWKNTYIFASMFINCDFKDFRIENSLIRGFKVSKLEEATSLIFENCEEVSGLIEINTEDVTFC